jgi:hypothetical protein
LRVIAGNCGQGGAIVNRMVEYAKADDLGPVGMPAARSTNIACETINKISTG